MKLINIREAGANNLLTWAIANGDSIKDDEAIHGLVNAETFYLVTLSDVNFFELFRLTQIYRNKVRIISEKKAAIPPRTELVKLFNGTYCPNKDDPETKAPLYQCVEYTVNNFINLALQMSNDNDIIHSSAVRLFLPMISRKFDVQIPVSFIDLLDSISAEEAERLFSMEYPATLEEITESDVHGFKTKLMTSLAIGTKIIKYTTRYNQYLRATKYFPLKKAESKKLYRFGLLGFFKYNEISRSEIRVNMFHPNPNLLTENMKRMNTINTPLKVEFVIELPIQYMQMLENSFDRDVLEINYESSMTSIIDEGIRYDDFITKEFASEDPTAEEAAEEYNNQINAYRVRIAEANEVLLKAIPILLTGNNENEVDTTSVFSMLPAIYTTKAVVTLNLDYTKKYIDHYDPVISELFKEMIDMSHGIVEDIKNSK